jgi:hypothetical protein
VDVEDHLYGDKVKLALEYIKGNINAVY